MKIGCVCASEKVPIPEWRPRVAIDLDQLEELATATALALGLDWISADSRDENDHPLGVRLFETSRMAVNGELVKDLLRGVQMPADKRGRRSRFDCWYDAF